MKRILITGGAGFIGSNLANNLVRQGFEVTVLDNLSEQVHSKEPEASYLFRSLSDQVRFIHGSVLKDADLREALLDQDVVVHLAAETGTGQSMYQVGRYVDVNIGGTAKILDILGDGKSNLKRFVIASSRSIYGEGKYLSGGEYIYPKHRNLEDLENGIFEIVPPKGSGEVLLQATDEESKIHPSSVYGVTKQVQEQLVMTVCPTLGIEPVALRYQNVYGPGQSLSNPYTGILSIFSNLIMSGKTINIFEDGNESRDFVFIDDVVDATRLAITHPNAANEVFNVGSGIATSVSKVAECLQRFFASEVEMQVSGNFRLGDIRHNYACLAKIGSRLGFKPEVSFDHGISKFAEWARALGPASSSYEKSISEMKERGLLK